MIPPVTPDQSAGAELATSATPSSGTVAQLSSRPDPVVEPSQLHAPAAGQAGPLSRSPQPRSSRRRAGRAPEVKLQLRLIRLSDALVVLSVLLPVFVITNIGRMPGGVAEFLAVRLTVKNLLLLSVFVLTWRVLCRVTGLYDWEVIKLRRAESARVVLTCGLLSAVALTFPVISVTGAFRYDAVLYFWIGSSAAMIALRNLVRTLVTVREAGSLRDALIVGTGPRAQRLYSEIRSTQPPEYNVVGFVDSDDRRPPDHGRDAILGLEQLERILMHNAIDEVLIALPIKSRYAEIQSVLESCERVGVRARYLADLFDPIKGRASHEGDRPSLVTAPRSPEGWTFLSKRFIDLLGASIALLVVAPALLLAMAAIKLSSPGPVLFSQERYGLNRRLFRMYKLRTMVVDAETLQHTLEAQNEASGPVFKIRQDPRVTAVGRFLRRTSLDEFPQLFNVLSGEMSLVGPRPLPIRDVHRFTEAALMRRFSVRPGVTCLWQISGRSNLRFDDWIRLDMQYIDEWSITLDVVILLKTIPAVLRGSGAS